MADVYLNKLINMRGAGNAEKALRKAGKWQLTKDEILLNSLNDALDSISDAQYSVTNVFNAMEAK